MRRVLLALASLVALVVVGACTSGGDAPSASSPGDTTSRPAATSGGVAHSGNGDEGLFDFSAPLVGGGTFDGAAVDGDLVVWFWSPW